ncbi:hypothetical protein [Leisingera sp. MMG026]|uniref:hypothetical protein n=1 Tax=Leisingera sp. MMG026 TaxID=2909982 RepID=UPI001F2313D9|nr:hypothetical protein [Leisingera sp. MMG026]MCF6431934.1 hypothetical protein [Leisingera sp. MMG026]
MNPDRVFRWLMLVFLVVAIAGLANDFFPELFPAIVLGHPMIEAIGSIVTAGAAIIAAWAAMNGLSTWKKERDADFAKALAAEMYRYRQSLHAIRLPFLTPTDLEFFEAGKEPQQVDRMVRRYRWRRSREVLNDVNALLAEAELRWPSDIASAFEPVKKIERELANDVTRYGVLESRYGALCDKQRAGQNSDEKWTKEFDKDAKERCELEGKLNDSFNDDDAFRICIDAAFVPMNTLLRTKI